MELHEMCQLWILAEGDLKDVGKSRSPISGSTGKGSVWRYGILTRACNYLMMAPHDIGYMGWHCSSSAHNSAAEVDSQIKHMISVEKGVSHRFSCSREEGFEGESATLWMLWYYEMK